MTHGQDVAFLIHSKPIAQLSRKISNIASFYVPLCRLLLLRSLCYEYMPTGTNSTSVAAPPAQHHDAFV
jgi:hypothetical protein